MVTTINGKPSVYFTPATLPNQPPTYETRIAETTAIAKGMADEELHRREQEWLADETAQREYQEYLDSVHGIPSDEELDRIAEEHEPTSLGADALHTVNSHGHRSQNGGPK